jgi:hypothetical protein
MRKIFLLVLLLPLSGFGFAADSTSYAPPGVTANRDMDRHGTAITNATTVRATGDMRAPIYYDSDNTGYFVDPAGTSRMNSITLGGVTKILGQETLRFEEMPTNGMSDIPTDSL